MAIKKCLVVRMCHNVALQVGEARGEKAGVRKGSTHSLTAHLYPCALLAQVAPKRALKAAQDELYRSPCPDAQNAPAILSLQAMCIALKHNMPPCLHSCNPAWCLCRSPPSVLL